MIRLTAVPRLAMLSLLAWPASARPEIVQRQVVTAIAEAPDGASFDVLTLAADHACGGRQLRMQASVLGMDEASYADMKADLAKQIREQAPVVVVIDRCPKPGAAGIPVALRLARCDRVTCDDGKARLYLDKNFSPAPQDNAWYQLLMPLPPGKVAGTWQVEIHEREGRIRYVSTHVDGPDFLYAKPVLGYTSYHVNGQVKTDVPMDAQGRQHGVASRYFDDGTLAARGEWRNGLREGVHRTYHHQQGRPQETVEYRTGVLVDGVLETFNQEGKVVKRMRVREGLVDGEVLSYGDDGVLLSNRSFVKGKANGPSSWFFPDGKVSQSGHYVDNIPSGEHIDYRPDGSLAGKRIYGDKGVMLSDEQFGVEEGKE